ncbi:MAG: acyl-CoA carboxylase epsilon subunit [Actinomycetes bacterium]
MRQQAAPGIDQAPVVRVVGHPDEAELAALVVTVLGLHRAPDEPPDPAADAGAGWADRAGMLGLTPVPGPAAWRASGRRW